MSELAILPLLIPLLAGALLCALLFVLSGYDSPWQFLFLLAAPLLVRNYDYALDVVSGRFEFSNWAGRPVIAKAQRPWGGCIDGMNGDGLVASLTYGGNAAQGLGFSVILMLRYVLEIEPLASAPAAQITQMVGPIIQGYLVPEHA